MTELYHVGIDFEQWRYKNDPTHVFFYHEKALAWIVTHMSFSKLDINQRLIRLSL